MKKFVFIYYGGMSPENASQEDMKGIMDKWMKWFETFKDQAVDGGNPFAPGGMSVGPKKTESITSDMWPATGYTIINAESMDEAVEIAKGCPSFVDDPEAKVRVYEAMPM